MSWQLAIAQKNNTSQKNYCPICQVLAHIDKSLQTIIDSPAFLMHKIDTGDCNKCFFRMVDTLKSQFITTSDKKYIIALDSIATHSDGAYTEYFENSDMFYKNFKAFCDYTYKYHNSTLFFCFIRELMFDIYIRQDAPDPVRLKSLKDFTISQEIKYKISGGEKKFIDSFVSRAKEEAKNEEKN